MLPESGRDGAVAVSLSSLGVSMKAFDLVNIKVKVAKDEDASLPFTCHWLKTELFLHFGLRDCNCGEAACSTSKRKMMPLTTKRVLISHPKVCLPPPSPEKKPVQ